MAFVELSAEPKLRFFYNVHAAVGPGAPNRRDDVLLVQHLLRQIYSRPVSFAPPLVPLAGPPLVVDGMAGPVTFQWIVHFQKEGKARGNNIATDGRVDRARGFVGSLSGTQYTILFMNNAFRTARPDVDHLWLAADCPPPLANGLIESSKPSAGGAAGAPQVPASGGA